jgi:hypothetical protein
MASYPSGNHKRFLRRVSVMKFNSLYALVIATTTTSQPILTKKIFPFICVFTIASPVFPETLWIIPVPL